MDPSNGTVSYTYARICAQLMNISAEFQTEYKYMEGARVDVGEFRSWAIENLPY
jgi:hypothetical protein